MLKAIFQTVTSLVMS